MSHHILLPRMMEIGKGASEKVSDILASLNCSKPLIVTDKMMVELGYAEKITAQLADIGIVADVFADTVPEPTVSSIESGVSMVRENEYDCIVALGGGQPY